MFVNLLTEIKTVDVYDRGIANQERIVLYINENLNLGQYGIMLGIRAGNGSAFPIRDNLFWFGDGIVNKGDWIYIYTGPGQPTVTPLPNTNEKLYSVHWGRKETILNNREIVPIIFRTDVVQVLETAASLPSGLAR
ncbi:MAG: hypothetical protein QY316_01390 [Thermodesulfobacteriota bacterium]|nr:MAG: hypothetical protein QY316_01390 [Thermodesulfobacteriota bacterium]